MRDLFIKFVLIVIILFFELFINGFQMPPSKTPILLQNQSFTNLALMYINASIYWAWNDSLSLLRMVLDRWNNIEDPIKRLGILFVSILLALNLRSLIKQRAFESKHAVYCPVDELPSRPIHGTVNRYRCPRGHQFAGDVGHHW